MNKIKAFNNFIMSIKHYDPTLIEAIHTGFKICFESEDSALINGVPSDEKIANIVNAIKIVPSYASVSKSNCVIDTLEAAGVNLPKNNIIMSGVKGELWNIGDISKLTQNYDRLDGLADAELKKYKNKSSNALTPASENMNLISGDVEDIGYFMKKANPVKCYQINEPFKVKVSWQSELLNGKPGDWFVVYGENDYGCVDNEIFNNTYKMM